MEPSTSSTAPEHPSTSSTTSLSNASSPTSPSLPTETLVHILGYALLDPSPLSRQKTRIAFSSVSRTFWHASRDSMGEVVVSGLRQARRFVKTLDREAKMADGEGLGRPSIASLILMEKSSSPAVGTRAGFDAVVSRLSQLKSFQYVSKDQVGSYELFGNAMYDALAALSALESFALFGPNRVLIQSSTLQRLLTQWPLLKKLHIPALDFDLARMSPVSVHLDALSEDLTCRVKVFHYISLRSSTALHNVVFADHSIDTYHLDDLPAVMSVLPPTLRSIVFPPFSDLPRWRTPNKANFHHALGKLDTLKTLVLPLSLMDPNLVVPTLKLLINLEEFDMSNADHWKPYPGFSGRSFQALVDFIEGLNSKLKRLVVSRTMLNYRIQADQDDLAMAATCVGIELVVED